MVTVIKVFEGIWRFFISCTLSIQQCIVNHFVLERIANSAVTGTECNTLAILRITLYRYLFFFYYFIIRRNSIDEGSRRCRRIHRRKLHRRRRSWLRFASRKGNIPARLKGWSEEGVTRTATGTPDELVDLGN